jgi:anhydro-N-acetylmuramic acid kinase
MSPHSSFRSDWFSPAWFQKPRLLCGLMTGTSMDGVDAAVVELTSADGTPDGIHSIRLLANFTKPFPSGVVEQLAQLAANKPLGGGSSAPLSLAHTGLASVYADVREVCAAAGVAVSSLAAVGSHGQTVWHQPKAEQFGGQVGGDGQIGGYSVRSTLQIGSAPTLAQLLGVTTIGDFRAADVALGGQGAPLAPMFDYQFLRKPDENIIALNLGGIANITVIPAGAAEQDVIAFDTGPSNLLIDASTMKFFGKRYDSGGSIGQAGRVLTRFMDALKEEPYITQPPPKSTGRELFNMEFLNAALKFTYLDAQPAEDAVRTVTEFTAWSIAENIRLFAVGKRLNATFPTRIIASGGGIHNACLMDALRHELPAMTLDTTATQGIPPDAKEAMFFAYFAYRTLGGLHSNMPSVTGASKEAVLGAISLG